MRQSFDSTDRNSSTRSSSSFVFGLILGAVVGAIIAVVIYRQNKGQVFDDLQEKLENFFHDLIGDKKTTKTGKPSKIKKTKKVPVTIPSKKTSATKKKNEIIFVKKNTFPKMFVKSKK